MFSLEKVLNNVPINNKSSCNIFTVLNILLIVIIITIFIFCYSSDYENFDELEHFSNINDDDGLINALDLGLCSKKCCPPYWSNEKIVDNRIKDEDIGKKIYTSNLFCSNGDGNKGCICLKDNVVDLLSNRGFVNK